MTITINSAQTDEEVVNMAVMICGKHGINTISTDDKFAQDAASFYGQIVQAELGSNRWRFALHSQQIASLTTLTPTFGSWEYYWDLPADMLMFQRLEPRTHYTIFGDRLLTRVNQPLIAIYLRSRPVSKWPEPFKLYIAYALADMLAISVTSSDRMVARIQENKKTWESRALFADGQSSPTRLIRSTPYINARS